MGNEGFLELTLLGVNGKPAADPATFVAFTRSMGNDEIGSATRAFPPVRRFPLPAFPQERAIICRISPERYRTREVGIFTLTDGETIRRAPTVFKVPQHWAAQFVAWANLPDSLQPLRDILDASPGVRVKGGKAVGRFTGATYDGVDPGDRLTVNAKACLLNLFGKLVSTKEPVFNRKPWFGFVETILEIGRERLIAVVDDEMLVRVREIHDNIDRFDDYKRTPVGDHGKNIPPGFAFTKSKMVSIKTREDHGNLQLTLTPAVDTSGLPVTLLDADLDENGKLMAHLGDLFKHRFSGGTHPFDIHEYLILEDPSRPLGYALV